MEASSTQWKGRAVPLREDVRFSTGRGTYIDDMKFSDTLHVALLRSVHAHARILKVDLSEALKMPGVVCGLTGEDAGRMSEPLRSLIPIPVQLDAYCLAYGKVTHVGEPVAAILAESRYLAEDALEKIRVEYEPLPAAVDPEAAMEAGRAASVRVHGHQPHVAGPFRLRRCGRGLRPRRACPQETLLHSAVFVHRPRDLRLHRGV